MPEADETALPVSLRFLKVLVTVLAGTMIVGLITIIGLFVTRLPSATTPMLPVLPESVALPDGATPRAITFGEGWIAVVTDQDQILIYDTGSGALRQEVRIAPGG